MLSPTRFEFLNLTFDVVDPSDWNSPACPRLWIYNLHYFDDLDGLRSEDREGWHRALIARWIKENPIGAGAGWEPYCLSLRIVNWCRYAMRGGELPAEAIESLAIQVRALADRLEVHLLGNHILANAKALIFAGLFFAGDEADRWLDKGAKLLRRELAEQVLPDGGHFELSPMYHAIILSDVLDLLELFALVGARRPADLDEDLREHGSRMLAWAAVMQHPDGNISFFNDAALGIAPPMADLLACAHQVHLDVPPAPAPLTWLKASGYVRSQVGPGALIVDLAEIGPDYIPGHAHADNLSFELSLGDDRLLVNTGVSTYEEGEIRRWERSTAAHNTVVIDESDSSEVWASFRVARRARPRDLNVVQGMGEVLISGAHDGYRWLPGKPIHRRVFRLSEDCLTIEDELRGRWRSAYGNWHLAPHVSVRQIDATTVQLETASYEIEMRVTGGEAVLEDGWYAPEFGLRLPTKRIRTNLSDARSRVTFRWLPS